LFHAPFIACTPGLDLTHVVTRSAQRAAQAADEYPGVTAVAGVPELLAEDVDLVVVASPSGLHVDHARAALAAGRHVVVDKPPAADAEQFEDLMTRAEQVGRHLIVFHNRRWDSEYRTLRAILDAGTLGTVHRFDTAMDRWRPLGKGGWRESAARGDLGGLRYDLGPHLVDQALQLFGPVREVYARVQSLRDVGSPDDDVLAVLAHDSGTTTVVSASLLTAIPAPRYRVSGTDGAATLQATDSQEDRLRAGDRPAVGGVGWGAEPGVAAQVVHGPDPQREVAYLDGRWPDFYAGVLGCLDAGTPNPVPPASALATMRVLDAIGEAAVTGGAVRLV
jgi:predicted dehydrogenase